MTKYLISLFLIAGVVISCTVNKPDATELNCYVINLDELKKEESIPASDFFKSVRVIPLETDEDILLAEIKSFQIANNKMFILDTQEETGVYVFDMEGHFLYSIGQMGEGPGEFSSVDDFTIDATNEIIYLLDYNEILLYDLNTGVYQGNMFIGDYRESAYIQFLEGKIFADINRRTDKADLLSQINPETGEEIDSWIDADLYNKGWMENSFWEEHSFFYNRNSPQLRYIGMFMNTVFSIEGEGVAPFLKVESKNWVKEEKMKELMAEHGASAPQHLFNSGAMYGIYGWVENKKLISFSLFMPHQRIFIDPVSGNSRVASIVWDDLLYAGPEEEHLQIFHTADENGFYSISNQPQFASNLQGRDLREMLNPEIDKRDVLINMEEDANPVVFYYEIR